MKISIITVCWNSELHIKSAMESVLNQTYDDIEYIIVDGNSKDATVDLIKSYQDRFGGKMKWISEPDAGLYDAMNKGMQLATGEVIGILNSDDFFADEHVLTKIAAGFQQAAVEAVIADIVFINDSQEGKILRKYSAKKWRPTKFAWGYMPPHPSFFAKRVLFEKFGGYKTSYKIAADYELLIRFLLIHRVNYQYIPLTTTKMRMGGASTKNIQSLMTLNKEILRACKENSIYSNYFMIYSKYLFKPFEFIFHE